MRGKGHRIPRLLAAVTGVLLLFGLPSPGPAQTPGVGELQQRQADLEARSRAAVVELYGLESRLAQARTDLARLDARARDLARRQASLRRQFQAARSTMLAAESRLGEQLRILYEQGEPDPIAVVLGATSLQDAIDGLELVRSATHATKLVYDEARRARRNLAGARTALAVQVRQTNANRARLAATEAGLEQARNERSAYLAGLRREQQLTAAQIGKLEAQAALARQKAQELTRQAVAQQAAGTQAATTTTQQAAPTTTTQQAAPTTTTQQTAPTTTAERTSTTAPTDSGTESTTAETTAASPSEPPPAPVESIQTDTAPAPAPAAAPPPPRPGGTMSVFATAYCLRGTTATGLPVGPGIVATDPTVIPLGTRMTIPGYGEGVAADTGGAITGARIDVWIGDCGEAANFTRTVTITFH